MAGTRIENGGLQSTSSGYTVGADGLQEKAGTRPRKNWMDIIGRDLKDMDITWDEAEEWRQTEQNGVNVWPNAPIWMLDELFRTKGLK